MAADLRFAHLSEVDSTNEDARRRALSGERGPIWIRADRQSAGRGRRGRAWTDAGGNLFATGLYTLDTGTERAAQLSFAAALAVGEVALAAGVDPALVTLKWPNDVLIGGAKCAGILLESGSLPDRRLWLAVGIGINLASHPEGTERPATDLSVHADTMSPEAAVQILAARFQTWFERWRDHGFAPLRDAWLARVHGLGERCEVRLDQETLTGVFADLTPDGRLRLDLADGTRRYIAAGDVFFPMAGRS